MPRAGKASIVRQVQERFDSMVCFGESKHAAKATSTAQDGIFSVGTYKAYLKHCCVFAKWSRETHGCKTLEDAKQYVPEWIQTRIDKGFAPATIKLQVSGLAKLYRCTGPDFGVATPSRTRAGITRSRGPKPSDKHFSEERNRDFVNFCKGVGLRRRELKYLTGDKLIENKDSTYSILVNVGAKGGRERIAPVIGPHAEEIAARMRAAGSGKVWEKLSSHADIHSYRADYATAIYRAYARPLEVCQRERFWNKEHYNGKGCSKGGYDRDSVYRFRGDRKGEWLDKAAMLEASKALGHNRISVVGAHYIRKSE